jgi:(2Fe-2S) ferredoxin
MVIGTFLSWPIAVLIARRGQVYNSGVPLVPYQRYVHMYPNVQPKLATWKVFNKYAWAAALFGGYLFSRAITDTSPLRNEWYNRPDFKPVPAMVNEHIEYDEVAVKQLMEQTYGTQNPDDQKKSVLRRFFRPKTSNWDVNVNLYASRPADQNFIAA